MLLRGVLVAMLALSPVPMLAQGSSDPLASVLDGAPPPAATLEDLRLTLQALDADLQQLRGQLVSTGQVAPGVPFDAGHLARLDAIEARIRTLTGQVEQIQFQVRSIAEEGGRRIADLDFRITELEGGDTAFVAPERTLGSETPSATAQPAPQVAVSEQVAFDAAKTLFDAGDHVAAATEFERFLQTFPGGPLTTEARYLMARSYDETGRTRDAAINYLNAFSAAPDGQNAPDALRRLAGALGRIGQQTEACLTYDEALARFAGEDGGYIDSIVDEKQALGCL